MISPAPPHLTASPADGKEALLIDHLAAAAAGGAGRAAAARLGALDPCNACRLRGAAPGFGVHPEDRFSKSISVVTQVLATLRPIATPRAGAAKKVAQAEKLAQKCHEVGELIRIDTSGALHRLVSDRS